MGLAVQAMASRGNGGSVMSMEDTSTASKLFHVKQLCELAHFHILQII
jgi:hypothetical protein